MFYEWKKRLRATEVVPFIAVEVASTEAASAEAGKMCREQSVLSYGGRDELDGLILEAFDRLPLSAPPFQAVVVAFGYRGATEQKTRLRIVFDCA
jgi:hypothetical protein